ncbi:HET-domain-containing protein [Xylariaceae sp. FL0016]|nr:HET-domain-containing protein [Xylariaceae sp. FL0016]
MLCRVCREGLAGIHDPSKTKRLGRLEDFPEILQLQFRNIENDDELIEALNDIQLEEPEKYVFGHHESYASLLHSKREGCVACADFGDMNNEDDWNADFAMLGYYSVFCIGLSRRDFPRPAMLVYAGEMLEEFPHEMVEHDDTDRVNAFISSSTSSPETWTLVRSWVDSCVQSHEMCRDHGASDFMPTRLLEVSREGEERIFRLVSGADLSPDDPYVTLSHCWGPGPADNKLRLLTSTETMLRDGLRTAILPRTFRDAFEIIERLNVRYLWIDRTCIVQDSPADWQAEASTMQTIYRHGFLNIAALGSADDEGGCFFERDPCAVAPAALDLGHRRRDGDREMPVLYRLEAENESWRATFEGEPLLARAWVLQERILSTRTLYFGSKQVFWECCESNCCETFPNTELIRGSPPAAAAANAALQKSSTSSRYSWKVLIDPNKRSTHLSFGTGWHDAVETYTRCNLTFADDKLVALSGLAKHMGLMLSEAGPGQSRDSYLAGIWQNTMPNSLLWRPATEAKRPASYRAPSWSWAAVKGSIRYGATSGFEWHVKVVEAEIIPKGTSETGQVSGGMVKLQGPLLLCKGLQRVKTRGSERETYSINSFQQLNDGPILEDFGDRHAYLQFDTAQDYASEVTLLIFNSKLRKAFSFLDIQGLALVLADESRLSYRRVGFIFLQTTVERADDKCRDVTLGRIPLEAVEIF